MNDLICATLAVVFWLFIILLIGFTFVVLVGNINCYFRKEKIATVKYMDISEYKTGDLFVISYNRICTSIVSFFTGNDWMHTGLYWVDPIDNMPYILEGADYKQPKYRTFFKIPFIDWYRINKSSRIVHIPINKELNPHLVYAKFENFVKYGRLSCPDFRWGRFLKYTKYKSYEEDDYKRDFTCNEAIIRTLKECNVFKHDYSESSYFPCCIYKRNVKCQSDYYYDDPAYILPGRSFTRGIIP